METAKPPSTPAGTGAPPPRAERPPRERPFPLSLIFAGLLVIAVFFGSFAAWSALAPIESAVVAPGVVSVESRRKTVQHFEGGIGEEIYVADGDRVARGAPRVRLRGVKPAAELGQLKGQRDEALAVIARLVAERDGAETISFPPTLAAAVDGAGNRSILADQENTFASRKRLDAERRQLFKQRIGKSRELIRGFKGKIAAVKRQQALTEDEVAQIQKLFKKGLATKPRLLAVQQRFEALAGELAELRANVARTERNILELRMELNELEAAASLQTIEQIRTERARLYGLEQQISAAEDVLRRTEIVSPIDGVIVNLQVHTLGGVIGEGDVLMEIVPSDDELIVEAFVDPTDIDKVQAGGAAQVELTTQSRRQRQPIDAVIVEVSADRLLDEQTGAPYYSARVRLDREKLASLGSTLVAGMGAMVFIRTGARTPLEYLLEPITRTLRLGLREE